MKTRWNTGRHYSAEGQLIAAEFDNGRMFFYDISRGIAGTYTVTFIRVSPAAIQESVMRHYDWNDYASPDYCEHAERLDALRTLAKQG